MPVGILFVLFYHRRSSCPTAVEPSSLRHTQAEILEGPIPADSQPPKAAKGGEKSRLTCARSGNQPHRI